MSLGSTIGLPLHRLAEQIISAPAFPLTRYLPRGRYWLYDVQRIARTKRFARIFDVGANSGQTAYSLTRFFPTTPIVCFEPASSPFQELKENYGSKPNVTLVNSALGSSPGSLPIHLNEQSELNSLIPGLAKNSGRAGSEIVKIDTVDDFCARSGIDRLSLLKMDVQGWEEEVVTGARGMFARHSVGFVYAEVAFRPDIREMQYFEPFNRRMHEAGLVFSGLYDTFRYGVQKEFVSFANALYYDPAYGSAATSPW